MKTHTSLFKENISLLGRELDSVVTFTINGTTTELSNEQLNSIQPHYEGAILKSVMKQLDIDSNVEIPVGTELNYRLGVKTRYNNVVDYRDNYDYIDYGNYIVKEVEKQEDTRSYKITCYDKMLYSMKDYQRLVSKNLLNINTFEKGRINSSTGQIEYANNTTSMIMGENKITFAVSQAWNSGIASDFIPVSQGDYAYSSTSDKKVYYYVDTYDASKTYVSRVLNGNQTGSKSETFTIGSGIAYIRIHYEVNAVDTYVVSNIQIEKNATATSYLPSFNYPITIKNYLKVLCDNIGLQFSDSDFANYDKQIQEELFLDVEGRSMDYTYRDVLDQIAEVSGGTICIDKNDKLEVRYITDTEDTIDEEYLKDINVNFGEKFGPVNTIVLSRGGEGDKISLSQPSNLADDQKVAIQITDNQIMNGNDRDTYLSPILSKLYGLEYYINDFSSTGICYYDLCDKYNISIGENLYSCIMFNDDVSITQGLVENIYTDMADENQQEYKHIGSTDRGVTQANIIAKKNEATITEYTQKVDEATGRLNAVETKQTDTDRTIEILHTNIDDEGNVTEVTTTTGFTFNAEGMTIQDSENDFRALHRNTGTFYYDGTDVVGQYTKDGSKQKDLYLFGVYYYGMEEINDNPMFVAQLYHDSNGEECFGHFYNRGD